jgi:hypothetical protein
VDCGRVSGFAAFQEKTSVIFPFADEKLLQTQVARRARGTRGSGMRLARAARLALFVACLVSSLPRADGAVDLYDQYTGPYDHTPPNARDARALRTVRAALVGTAGVLDRWEGDYPCAHPWEFVRCVGGNEVTHLELSRLNFAGVLDPAVGDIASLEVLDVSSNFIAGEIPASLGNLTRLRVLNAANNALEGAIPPELANAPSLTSVSLARNRLTGSVPNGPWPSTLAALDLSDNRLAGEIPRGLFGSGTRIASLLLQNNAFTGRIPVEVGNWRDLWQLKMQGNALVGFVPSEIGSFLKRLTLLDLSRNLLTGSIPENLADLPKLKELYLHNNQFIGGTPAKLVARNVTVFVR